MKKNIYTLLTIAILFLGIKAGAQVTSVYNTIRVCNTDGCSAAEKNDAINTFAGNGYIGLTLQKAFNFSYNGANQNDWFELPVGQTAYSAYSDTSGSWDVVGAGISDTPPLDGQLYRFAYGRVNGSGILMDIYVGMSNPTDQGGISITSSDPSVADCNQWGCWSKKPGTATITVNFPNNTFNISSVANEKVPATLNTRTGTVIAPARDETRSYEVKPKTFSIPSLTYYIVVPSVPNTPHVTACTGATNITKTGATLNWSYTDAEGDLQTDYHVQVATDPGFSNIVWAGSNQSTDNGNTRSITIPEGSLTPSTTYYTRVSTDNTANGSGNWVNCGGSFTTNDDENKPTTCTCQGRDQVCTGATPTTTLNSPSCAFSSLCLLVSDSADTATISIVPKNGIGPIQYQYDGKIVTQNNNQSFVTTINKITTDQTIAVMLTDSDSSTSNTSCSVAAKGGTTGGGCVGTSCGTGGGTDPKITIEKIPAVTLNKNGSCTISWTIVGMPTGATCLLSGWGVDIRKPSDISKIDITNSVPTSITIPGLQSNQKYTITCSGGTPPLTPAITASVICRVNPDVKEN